MPPILTKFKKQIRVRFAHCDPAGIIFYPRFFELLNGIVEDWFLEALDHSFSVLFKKHSLGTPMVDVHVEFLKPCFLDDLLDIEFYLTYLGKSSAIFYLEGQVGGHLKIRAEGVLVCSFTNLSSSHPWPETIRQKMQNYVHDSNRI